jgi:hypothetical protein
MTFINIYIGPMKACWTLPGHLLDLRLPQLRRLADIHGPTALHLPKEDPAVFATIVDWLFSGNIACHGAQHDDNYGNRMEHWLLLNAILKFAEEVNSDKLILDTEEHMRACLQERRVLYSPQEIQCIFNIPIPKLCILVVQEALDKLQEMPQDSQKIINILLELSDDLTSREDPTWVQILPCHPEFRRQLGQAIKNSQHISVDVNEEMG